MIRSVLTFSLHPKAKKTKKKTNQFKPNLEYNTCDTGNDRKPKLILNIVSIVIEFHIQMQVG